MPDHSLCVPMWVVFKSGCFFVAAEVATVYGSFHVEQPWILGPKYFWMHLIKWHFKEPCRSCALNVLNV